MDRVAVPQQEPVCVSSTGWRLQPWARPLGGASQLTVPGCQTAHLPTGVGGEHV